MEINELNSLSPMRVFDKAIGGGLGKGNLGVLVSRRGVGKTACLVQLATDKLLHGEHVIHVSFNGNVEHVIAWYKEVFSSISKGLSLDDANSIYEQIVRHRFVMNFSQEDVSIKKVLSNLETQIKDGILKADAVLFDGYKLTLASQEDVQAIKKFAEDLQLEVWFSVSPVRSDATIDKYGVPNTIEPYRSVVDVLIGLKYDDATDKVVMTCVHAHGKDLQKPVGVDLDPRTMLISR